MKKVLLDILKHVIIKLLDIFFAVIGDEVKKYCKRDDVRAKVVRYALPRLMKAGFTLKRTNDKVKTFRKRTTDAVNAAKMRVRSAADWARSKIARKKPEGGDAKPAEPPEPAEPEPPKAPAAPGPAEAGKQAAPPANDVAGKDRKKTPESVSGYADRLAEMLRKEREERDGKKQP